MSHSHGIPPDQGSQPARDNRGRKSIKCLNCQARRAKCSSDHPACIQCLNRGEVCYYNGEPAVETDHLRSLRSRVAVLSDKDKTKYQKRKAKAAAEEGEEDSRHSLRKAHSTPMLGSTRTPGHSGYPQAPLEPPRQYFTRSVSKSPTPTMGPMTPVTTLHELELSHNAWSSMSALRSTPEAFNLSLPSKPSLSRPPSLAVHAPIPKRASTTPQAFSFVNYTEEDADELMEAVAPSGGRGGSSPQKSRQPTILSSDDEFAPPPKAKGKPRYCQQSLPDRKSSLKTAKSVSNLRRPSSAMLSPTDVSPFPPSMTPVSAMIASTVSAPFVEQAPRPLKRFASGTFSPSLSTVADLPDQLIDPQLHIGPIPDLPAKESAPAGATLQHTPTSPYPNQTMPNPPAQAYTFMRPGSLSLYVRIPPVAPHVSVTVPPAVACTPWPGAFPPFPPLPSTAPWTGDLPSPNPSLLSPTTATTRLGDPVKLDAASDPYLLITAPMRSPSPAFSSSARSSRNVSDPLVDQPISWHASPPLATPSAVDSAPPTPYLTVPGMSGYFHWVPEPGQATGLLPTVSAQQDDLVVQE